jgi:hypothetical protein
MGDGIFGIDKFSMALIIFTFLFLLTGVLSYKFGLTSPEGVLLVALFVVALFDVGLGMMPPIHEKSIRGFPTFLVLLVLIAVYLRGSD